MLRKATAGAAQQPPERAEKYLQERTDFTLKSYGIKDRAWHRHRHMGSLYRSDQKIEEKLQGIVILELRGYYPPSEGPHSTVWDLRLDVRWNSHTQQMVMSLYDSSSDQWTEVSGFDYLLELAAELMSKPPILWSKEINSWRKKVSGSLDEAYHIFCQMLREDRNLAHKVIYYGDLSDHTFYGLNSMGIFDEVMSVIKAIDAELEPIKLLRRIANNTDSIAATSAISAMGTVALGRLTAQNSQILDTISGKISALGDGKRR